MTYISQQQPINILKPSFLSADNGSLCCVLISRNLISVFLAHLSRRLRGELIVYRSSRPSLRPSVCVFTLSNMNISETNGSIATKFYLKHYLGWGLAALGFGPDRIRTLVSMATEKLP